MFASLRADLGPQSLAEGIQREPSQRYQSRGRETQIPISPLLDASLPQARQQGQRPRRAISAPRKTCPSSPGPVTGRPQSSSNRHGG